MKQITLLMMLLIALAVFAQEPATDGKIMVAVFLRHDQTKTLSVFSETKKAVPERRPTITSFLTQNVGLSGEAGTPNARRH